MKYPPCVHVFGSGICYHSISAPYPQRPCSSRPRPLPVAPPSPPRYLPTTSPSPPVASPSPSPSRPCHLPSPPRSPPRRIPVASRRLPVPIPVASPSPPVPSPSPPRRIPVASRRLPAPFPVTSPSPPVPSYGSDSGAATARTEWASRGIAAPWNSIAVGSATRAQGGTAGGAGRGVLHRVSARRPAISR
ncbi:unnamed protein product [Closterium sp. Yama58-4]|nr:unnamed protein product [Closterium sp. Yama58-4]